MQLTTKLRKYGAVLRTAASSRLAYWQETVGRVFFFGIVLLIFSQLWLKVLSDDGLLAGFSRGQLVWYVTLTEIIMLTSTSLLRQVETDVKTGQIAYMLTRPFNYLIYQWAYYLGEVLVSLLLNTLAGCLVATLLVGPPPTSLPGVVQAAFLLGLAIVLQFCVHAIIALLSFFVEECRPFYWIYSKLIFVLGGLFVPIDIYPKLFQQLARALPFQSITYAPARSFISGDWILFGQLVTTALIWVFILSLLLRWQYAKGVCKINVNGG